MTELTMVKGSEGRLDYILLASRGDVQLSAKPVGFGKQEGVKGVWVRVRSAPRDGTQAKASALAKWPVEFENIDDERASCAIMFPIVGGPDDLANNITVELFSIVTKAIESDPKVKLEIDSGTLRAALAKAFSTVSKSGLALQPPPPPISGASSLMKKLLHAGHKKPLDGDDDPSAG